MKEITSKNYCYSNLPVFIVETKQACYYANDLTEVLNLWKDNNDNSEVIRVEKLG